MYIPVYYTGYLYNYAFKYIIMAMIYVLLNTVRQVIPIIRSNETGTPANYNVQGAGRKRRDLHAQHVVETLNLDIQVAPANVLASSRARREIEFPSLESRIQNKKVIIDSYDD